MKHLFLSVFCLLSLNSIAATNITTTQVSGHWTLAGSPYNVYNDVNIPYDKSLTIDAGVQVVFQGSYNFIVYGILNAPGTATAPIVFDVQDTTGFTTDNATAAGGWHGIQFFTDYTITTGSNVFQYCNIIHTKFCAADDYKNLYGLLLATGMVVNDCNIYNNRTTTNASCSIIGIATRGSATAELAGCNIYNNFSNLAIIENTNEHSSNSNIHHCKIHGNNAREAGIISLKSNALLKDNDIYLNKTYSTGSNAATIVVTGKAVIKSNIIHDNSGYNSGAILSSSGLIDVIGNMLYNNRHTNGSCGIVDGGGAMNLAWSDGATSHDNTFFNVKNNVVTNNFSPYCAGGLKIYCANASVSNNHIINNQCINGAALYVFDNASSTVVVKNNLFYGNAHDTDVMGTPAVKALYVSTGSVFQYDHNWTQHASAFDLVEVLGSGFTVTTDATTNIQGSSPGMVSPTTTRGISTGVLTANFDLMTASPCINAGDVTGITPETMDCAGRERIHNGKIDIGAYEYGGLPSTIAQPVAEQRMQVYPNPAVSQIFVAMPEAKGSVTITDVTGKVVTTTKVASTLTYFDIRSLTRGIYFIKWNDGDNVITTQKLAVE